MELPYEAFRYFAATVVAHGTVAEFVFFAATSREQYRRCVLYIEEEALLSRGYGMRMLVPSGELNELIISRTCYCGRISWDVRAGCKCWTKFGNAGGRRVPRAFMKISKADDYSDNEIKPTRTIFPIEFECVICNSTHSTRWFALGKLLRSTVWSGWYLICNKCFNSSINNPITREILNGLIADWWYLAECVSDNMVYRAEDQYLDKNKFGHLIMVFGDLLEPDTSEYRPQTIGINRDSGMAGVDFIKMFDPDSPLVALAAQIELGSI
jgi:hypothetical protein